jgi:hypothetical protein
MKKEDVQDAVIRILMIRDLGFTALRKGAEEYLRHTKDKNYNLHDDVFNEALTELIINKTVHKVEQKNGRSVYRLAPQRKEENLLKIEKSIENVSYNLKNINQLGIGQILDYVNPIIKSLSQQYKRLLVRKHFAGKDDTKRIVRLLVRIDEVIGEAVALIKNKEEKKLPDLYTSINHTINMEFMSPSYICSPDPPSNESSGSYGAATF